MLPSKLLRFKDLKCVAINNWPTLKRRIANDNFPPGRYLGENTRVWTQDEVEAWWLSRPSAGPPPENAKPATPVPSRGSGRESNFPFVTPGDSGSVDSVQPRHGGRR
jgi:predicted DNA-binding transcriptional regulator AlpA